MDQVECDQSRTVDTTEDMSAGIAEPLFTKDMSLGKTRMLSAIK